MNEQNPGTIADTAQEVSKIVEGKNVEASESEREDTGRDSAVGEGAARDEAGPVDETAEEEQPRRGDEPVANLE